MASSELVSVSVPHVKAEAQLSVPFTENLHRKSAESLQVRFISKMKLILVRICITKSRRISSFKK